MEKQTMNDQNTEKMPVPSHIAIIMDGNGRWAQRQGMPRVAGHNAGMKSLKATVRACGELGIGHLTVYAFSTENWKRPQDEVSGIFKIMVLYIKKELKELNEENVKVIGEGREINRHNFTMEEIDESVKKDVVQRLLKLIDFRNYYEAFDGKFTVHNTEDDQIKLSWQKDDKICTLNVNLENYKSIIEYIDKYGNLKIYDI